MPEMMDKHKKNQPVINQTIFTIDINPSLNFICISLPKMLFETKSEKTPKKQKRSRTGESTAMLCISTDIESREYNI